MVKIKYIEHYPILASTMLLAEEYIKSAKYDDHFLIVTIAQTSARGRKGNDWHSPAGGLWFNLVLDHISQHNTFTLFIGYCIAKSLIALTNNDNFKIKWPNDIYLYKKKVCGIICTQYKKYNKTNIGIGINTNIPIMPYETLPKANSIQNLLQIEIDNTIYLNTIINEILNNLFDYEKQGIALFYDFYQSHDYLKSKSISIDSQAGIYKGLNTDGGIIIKNQDDREQILYSGEVKEIDF